MLRKMPDLARNSRVLSPFRTVSKSGKDEMLTSMRQGFSHNDYRFRPDYLPVGAVAMVSSC